MTEADLLPEERRHRSKPDFDAQKAAVCENCELENGIMGKHIVVYTATDEKGKIIETLALCLSCRFAWLSALARYGSYKWWHAKNGRLLVEYYGIVLTPQKLRKGNWRFIQQGEAQGVMIDNAAEEE